ncbi:sigma-54 interaction domain-containing protein [Pseudomonas sp. NPDC089734]|uniref:sigma-54 interaction domain-containing protein n=1 Tax=Pseudomonas sp. NPDC089734 TaxID=3364469 RepID=UPI00382E0045
MFALIDEPLGYAQRLCAQYKRLSGSSGSEMLAHDFVLAATELSGCELIQLYMHDAPRSRLSLNAECLEGIVRRNIPADTGLDLHDAPLLQFCLEQQRVITVNELGSTFYDVNFLPAHEKAWKSLLCVPLVTQEQRGAGLLLCVSQTHRSLDGFSESLEGLGTFLLSQLQLLQRLPRPRLPAVSSLDSAQCPSRYGLIGQSVAMRQVCRLMVRVLNSPCTVLLTGETGTGKEVVSRAIHEHGPRRSRPFIVQNCAAFPEGLLESELFGYRKGAFTGADRDRPGLFDSANGGTLLLDEIGDMPLSLQAKLLRVLQEGEIRSLGSSETRKVDVRIIAATHRDLPALVAQGQFREDLYYRLAQFPIELPSLHQREDDIVTLAVHFADRYCHFLQRTPVQWSEVTLALLRERDFPGNIRELKGLVERAVLLCDGGELLPEHFSFEHNPVARETGFNLRKRLEQVERSVLIECLRKSGGNRSLAARRLGVARRTLLYRMAHLNIKRDEQ